MKLERLRSYRCLILICLFLLSLVQFNSIAIASNAKHAQPLRSFTGAWSDISCPENEGSRCGGGFVLYLVQKGDRICGTHFSSSLGAGQLDEGGPRSVTGKSKGSTALVSITSGRDKSVFEARIEITKKSIRWKRLKQLTLGDLDQSLIPEEAQLKKTVREEDQEAFRHAVSDCGNL